MKEYAKFSKKKSWAHISLQCMKCKNKFHIEHSENCHQSQPSNFFKVWTFFRCFDRDLWKMRQNNKFDTAQLFNYILNTQKMFHQSQPSGFFKVWTFFDVLADILERWSRITNLTLPNCFITYWTLKKCFIKTNQVFFQSMDQTKVL